MFPQFDGWYRARREEMKADAAMVFFLGLRNISQKRGPVGYIGGLNRRWSYRFVSIHDIVPPELVGRDIIDCCASHLQKLAEPSTGIFSQLSLQRLPRVGFQRGGNGLSRLQLGRR
jgi:hypothetical protein